MKIFHILAGKANPDTPNGVNKVVHALATEQTELGHDVTVIGIAENTVKRHQPIYRYHLFSKHRIPFSVPQKAVSLLLNESDSTSIFHFHSVFIPWFLPLMRKLKTNGRRHIILTPHGAYIEENMRSLKKRLYFSLIESRVIRAAECIHVIGYKTETNPYITKYARRYVCIPNGFGVESVAASTAQPSLTIGALCRLYCFQKGLDVLIPAFAEYKRQGGRYLLKIAGSGADEKRLRALILQEDMQEAISLLGPVYGEQKWEFLQACVAHISPSRFEGLPTACLESASVGCIQLTTEATNMGKYIRRYHAGSVIERTELRSLINQLMEFDRLSEDEINRMRHGARRMIQEELNWSLITQRILTELYNMPIQVSSVEHSEAKHSTT